jgi:hypothetical protein
MKNIYENNMMKFLNSIIILIGIISIGIFMQNCSKEGDELNIETNFNSENAIKNISNYQIPEGVTPIVLKNKEELYALCEKIDNMEIEAVFIENFRPRLKGFSEHSGSVSTTTNIHSNNYQILITLAWSSIGGSITVSSVNYSTWYFSSWTQNTGVANWEDNNSRIRYNITVTLKIFALIDMQLFEVSRHNKTVSGYING